MISILFILLLAECFGGIMVLLGIIGHLVREIRDLLIAKEGQD